MNLLQTTGLILSHIKHQNLNRANPNAEEIL